MIRESDGSRVTSRFLYDSVFADAVRYGNPAGRPVCQKNQSLEGIVSTVTTDGRWEQMTSRKSPSFSRSTERDNGDHSKTVDETKASCEGYASLIDKYAADFQQLFDSNARGCWLLLLILLYQCSPIITSIWYAVNGVYMTFVRRLVGEIDCEISVNHGLRANWIVSQSEVLTTTMKVKFHKSHGRMNAEIIYIFVITLTYPGKVGLIEMILEQLCPVAQNFIRVVLVECSEQCHNSRLLMAVE